MDKKSINIMGVVYTIDYVNKLSDIDIEGRRTDLLAQIEHVKRSIRILDDGKNKGGQKKFPFFLLIHEMVHGMATCANIECLSGDENEEIVDTLATVLADTLVRNGMIKEEWLK